MVMHDILVSIRKQITITSMINQGDDITLTCKDIIDAQYIIGIMNFLGYKVHAQKTFLSRTRTEFLQRSFEKHGISGYLPRSLLGMRYRHPVLEIPISKVQRILARFLNWQLIVVRGGDVHRAMECYVMDAEQIGLRRD